MKNEECRRLAFVASRYDGFAAVEGRASSRPLSSGAPLLRRVGSRANRNCSRRESFSLLSSLFTAQLRCAQSLTKPLLKAALCYNKSVMVFKKSNNKSSGQAIIFILMALLILVVAFMWTVDVHLLWTTKTKAQNAGDAAALAAARWQGNTLNMVGELNLMHVIALDARDSATIDAITNMQARLCFTGPLSGLKAAQVAAKKNGAKNRDEFTRRMKEHAAEVSQYYDIVAGTMALPEPYPNAWREYQGAILDIANDGIAVAPDNAQFFGDVTSGHILLDKAFYEAIAGRSWCYFFLNWATGGTSSTRTILDDFTNYTFFGEIPPPAPPLFRNSEIFGIGLSVAQFKLSQRGGLVEAIEASAYVKESGILTASLSTNATETVDNWYVYDRSVWENYWPGMTYGDEDFLPLTGSVREEYNYTGVDTVTRLYLDTDTFTSPKSEGSEKEIVWTAAAKAFGYLHDPENPETRIRPNTYGFVLPAFRDVRLIPMDSASSGGDSTFDIDWREHTDEHLPIYTSSGRLEDGCKYCILIGRFEDEDFRIEGSEWLAEFSHLCLLPSSSGKNHGGGTRRGH